MIKLYEIQPASCRMPLPQKDYTGMWWFDKYSDQYPYVKRVLEFDPTETFERLRLGDFKSKHRKPMSPYNRMNIIACQWVFPSIEGFCSCGCGVELPKGHRRWANEHCEFFGNAVTRIIAGHGDYVKKYVSKYQFGHIWGLGCQKCGVTDVGVEFDHIIPVHRGGGLCWLSNYQVLCLPCHKEKTKLEGRPIMLKPAIVIPEPKKRKSIFGYQ